MFWWHYLATDLAADDTGRYEAELSVSDIVHVDGELEVRP
jgi:hypothetical protein